MQKDLAGIGALFAGTAALLGIFWVKDYWKETRQLAAAEILRLLREFIDKTNKIILLPDLYQYEEHYPFNIPELQNREKMPSDWTRPNRLIANNMGALMLALNKPLSKLVGKEYYQIIELTERLEYKCRSITGWLQAKLGDHPDKRSIIQQYDSDKYPEMLKSILREAEKILFPIINGN